jgi:hypothetical protein
MVMLAEWTSPLLVIGFLAAFVVLAVKRRLSFIDLIFPIWVAAYLLVPFHAFNQYGPRYYLEAFPFLALTLVSLLAPLLSDTSRPRRAAFVWSLLMAHTATCVAAAAVIGFCVRTVVNQRMDLYDQVQAAQLHRAIVVLRSGTSNIASLHPYDLTRNGISLDGDVIYALDLRDSLTELQRLMPDRTMYVYERAPRSSTGALRRLDDPAAQIAVY